MHENIFDPKKLHKLNNPDRLSDIPPEFILNKLNLKDPSVLVDIGAGTGFFSIPFAAYVKTGKVFACDISVEMINWMKENVCPKYPNIIPLKMEENTVPLEDGVADLVYMINLHHELDEPEKMLKESLRLLKNNGKIFIVDWRKEDMPEGPPENIRCLPEEVKNQLISVGFKNVTVYDSLPKHFLIISEK
ncbi:MAG: class I SAM-dependent methyltransferase [Calditrichaeota bacterium]|nr:class I SAM-dependent methyltransferase [Calditrichota bacterium]